MFLVSRQGRTAIEASWRDLWTATIPSMPRRQSPDAMSALTSALWDAVGKQNAQAAACSLGAFTARKYRSRPVPCFARRLRRQSSRRRVHYVKQELPGEQMQVAHVHTPSADLDNVRRSW